MDNKKRDVLAIRRVELPAAARDDITLPKVFQLASGGLCPGRIQSYPFLSSPKKTARVSIELPWTSQPLAMRYFHGPTV